MIGFVNFVVKYFTETRKAKYLQWLVYCRGSQSKVIQQKQGLLLGLIRDANTCFKPSHPAPCSRPNVSETWSKAQLSFHKPSR